MVKKDARSRVVALMHALNPMTTPKDTDTLQDAVDRYRAACRELLQSDGIGAVEEIIGIAKDAIAVSAQVREVEVSRCVVTGNPCGTDTVSPPNECPAGGQCRHKPAAEPVPVAHGIERFDSDNDGIMEPYPLGEYVRYTDHARRVAFLERSGNLCELAALSRLEAAEASLAASEARVAELERLHHARMEAKHEAWQQAIDVAERYEARLARRTEALEAWQQRAEKAEASLAACRAFAQDVMECWPEGAPDGGDLQEFATKHGLLREVMMPGPCGENCSCNEFISSDEWPSVCYRKTTALTGKPESDAAMTTPYAHRRGSENSQCKHRQSHNPPSLLAARAPDRKQASRGKRQHRRHARRSGHLSGAR